jgi:hypothetical protein
MRGASSATLRWQTMQSDPLPREEAMTLRTVSIIAGMYTDLRHQRPRSCDQPVTARDFR